MKREIIQKRGGIKDWTNIDTIVIEYHHTILRNIKDFYMLIAIIKKYFKNVKHKDVDVDFKQWTSYIIASKN